MRDEWFIRGNVPMTKSEVRAVSLSKLGLYPGAVLYDIGAGTGSVSVEAALFWGAKVWAVEKKAEAVSLLKQNIRKAEELIKQEEKEHPGRFAAAGRVCAVEGEALSLLESGACRAWPRPTHAFLGGTSGGMEPIVKELLSLNPDIRIVINVIALESLAAASAMLEKLSVEAEIVSIQAARAKRAGSFHLMQGMNPVYIISFGGEDVEKR